MGAVALKTDYEIMNAFAAKLLEQVKSRIPSVTGKTLSKIRSEVFPDSITIWGPPYIGALEHGRGPTKTSTASNPNLFDAIKEWALAKGIIPDTSKQSLGLVYAITNKIHREGTLLYRNGGNSGVLSHVLRNLNTTPLTEALASKYAAELTSEVLNVPNLRVV